MTVSEVSKRTVDVSSYCRICTGQCGTIVTIDEDDGRVVAVKGDRNDTQSLGFICSKGTNAPEFHYGEGRLLHPLRREADGTFTQINLETALHEIGERFAAIYERDGPDAIATFRGSGGFYNSIILGMLDNWLAAIGSHKAYSTLTIDQSAKTIVPSRLGYWAAGKHRVNDSDVALLIGANPLVSITQLDSRNPVKRFREQQARGTKLIIIDPRRTESAQYADLFVQPYPGHDSSIVAAVIRIILDNGWHDKDFCDANVADLPALRTMVDPFTPEAVARSADVPVEQLHAIAQMFARDSRRGTASTGTGPDMAPHSNLTEHLVECLNVICGRMIREGERMSNTGFLFPTGAQPAQVVHLPRTWEQEPKNRINGFGLVGGEMATSAMADDIARPGPGQVRCLISFGGNPANCVPDQRKMVDAMRTLELMVTVDPVMTPTAELSHYILPPRMFYERPDLPIYIFESFLYPEPFSRYTPKLVDPPKESQVCTEWDLLWNLARRVGKTLTFLGQDLDMETAPDEDALLAIVARNSIVPYEELKQLELGCVVDQTILALAKDPTTAEMFTTMPVDVVDEMHAMEKDWKTGGRAGADLKAFPFLLSSRRQRHRYNSMGFKVPVLHRAMPFNPVFMNPEDMAQNDISDGDTVDIHSENGSIRVLARPDETMRRGVVSISHGFGGLPDQGSYLKDGVSPNILISTDNHLQSINGMPRMSGVPVNVKRC